MFGAAFGSIGFGVAPFVLVLGAPSGLPGLVSKATPVR